MLDIFRRATESALAALGEGALLRGSVPCVVNVEDGLQLTGLDTNFEAVRESRNLSSIRSVATISSEYNPKIGDALTVGDRIYRLDMLLEDAGAFRRFVLLKV
ncbi:MAG: hypothetical protein RIS35_3750 [Pseudomonadota bacterium]|jgi:hypothetical protein